MTLAFAAALLSDWPAGCVSSASLSDGSPCVNSWSACSRFARDLSSRRDLGSSAVWRRASLIASVSPDRSAAITSLLVGRLEDVGLARIELALDALNDPIANVSAHGSLGRADHPTRPRVVWVVTLSTNEVRDLRIVLARELDRFDHDRLLAVEAHQSTAPSGTIAGRGSSRMNPADVATCVRGEMSQAHSGR